MDIIQALILGIVQGITEFLPISSSGHLVLGEEILGLKVDELKSFDVVVHVGTLVAIFIYFWKDFVKLLKSLFDKSQKQEHKLILYLVLATIPAVLIGLTLEDQIDSMFRNKVAVGIMMAIVGLYFFITEYLSKQKNSKITLPKAILIGIAQAVALIPGVSRSGSTIATGVLLGIDRVKAARFSFLLGSIAITGAGILTGVKVVKDNLFIPDTSILLVGFFASVISGLLSVAFLMKFLKKYPLWIFSIYLFIIAVLALTF